MKMFHLKMIENQIAVANVDKIFFMPKEPLDKVKGFWFNEISRLKSVNPT